MFNVIEIDNLNVVHQKKTVKAKLESRASKSKSAKKTVSNHQISKGKRNPRDVRRSSRNVDQSEQNLMSTTKNVSVVEETKNVGKRRRKPNLRYVVDHDGPSDRIEEALSGHEVAAEEEAASHDVAGTVKKSKKSYKTKKERYEVNYNDIKDLDIVDLVRIYFLFRQTAPYIYSFLFISASILKVGDESRRKKEQSQPKSNQARVENST